VFGRQNTQAGAAAACASMDMQLLSIETQQEYQQLTVYLSYQNSIGII